MRFTRLLLAVAALAAFSGRADAYWLREDWFGIQAENGRTRMRLGDFAVYESETGLGLGVGAFEGILAPWDVPRVGLPDASAHALYEIAPLKAYLALYSWRGPTYLHMTSAHDKDRSIGKIELYGSYCNWATLTEFNDVETFVAVTGRQAVPGAVRARVVDYGVRVDQGVGDSFALAGSIGRFELSSYANGPFRARRTGNWYAALELYFGTTKGSDYGGGVGRLFLRAADEIGALFGGSVVHRERLPSTSSENP